MTGKAAGTASAVKERRRTRLGSGAGRLDRREPRAGRPLPARPGEPRPPASVRWVEFCAVTEQGRVRSSHEDALVVGGVTALAAGARVTGWLPLGGDPTVLAAVDGMGGYAGGAEAAALVASALATDSAAVPGAAWDTFFNRLSSRLAAAGEAWGTPNMGATVALLRLTPDRAEAVNVGDCRTYRAAQNRLSQLSVDDRMPGEMGGGVTQALGAGAFEVESHRREGDLGLDAVRFMACTDGLFGALGPAALRRPLVEDRSAASACDALVTAAWDAGATDNFSVIVADVAAQGALPPAAPPGIRLH